MSKDLTANMVTEVTANALAPIWLVKAEFDSGDLNLWTGYGEIIFDTDTYVGAGDLLNISETVESEKIEANGITVSLTGELDSLIALTLTEPLQDRPLTVFFGALNTSTGALISDPYPLFGGRMDVPAISNNASTTSIGVAVESNLSILKRARNRKYTSEDQKLDYPTDTFFDTVPGLQDATVAWGRESS